MAEFVFNATHDVYYSTKTPVPISEVIESLAGLERLIRMTPRALQGLTGIEIDRVEVFVEHLESGSLLETVLIRFFFKDQAGLEAFIDKVRDKVGDGAARNILIGAVIATLLYYGADLLATAKGGATTHITANNNVIINAAAGEVKLTPEMFQAIVQGSVAEKKDLAKSTVQIMKPARADPEAAITFDNNAILVVPADVVREVPSTVDLQPDARVEEMKSAELLIRATNRDSLKTGWTARLPLRFDQKLRLKLSDGIDPEVIAGLATVQGDIQIHYRLDSNRNQYVPDYIVLMRLTTH